MTTSGTPAEEGEEQLRRALGRVIAMRRAELGMKRNDLRDLSSLSYPYLAELEHGTKRPSQSALSAIAEALQLRPSELLERAEALLAGDDVRPSWFHSSIEAPMVVSSRRSSASPAPASPPFDEAARRVVADVVREVVRDELRRAGIEPGPVPRRPRQEPRGRSKRK